ncbi:MAG: hypothetical protein NVS3B26_25850 [Mycobacteriales bacterium]
MTGRELPLANRPLGQPAPSRLARNDPLRGAVLAAHDEALRAGAASYRDPVTGLLVLTAAWLADRGTCCGNGCRHCPYLDEPAGGDAPASDTAVEGVEGIC